MSVINKGTIVWRDANDSVKHAAKKVAKMIDDDMVLIDMESVGDNFPTDDFPATVELRKVVEEAIEEGADYLLLF